MRRKHWKQWEQWEQEGRIKARPWDFIFLIYALYLLPKLLSLNSDMLSESLIEKSAYNLKVLISFYFLLSLAGSVLVVYGTASIKYSEVILQRKVRDRFYKQQLVLQVVPYVMAFFTFITTILMNKYRGSNVILWMVAVLVIAVEIGNGITRPRDYIIEKGRALLQAKKIDAFHVIVLNNLTDSGISYFSFSQKTGRLLAEPYELEQILPYKRRDDIMRSPGMIAYLISESTQKGVDDAVESILGDEEKVVSMLAQRIAIVNCCSSAPDLQMPEKYQRYEAIAYRGISYQYKLDISVIENSFNEDRDRVDLTAERIEDDAGTVTVKEKISLRRKIPKGILGLAFLFVYLILLNPGLHKLYMGHSDSIVEEILYLIWGMNYIVCSAAAVIILFKKRKSVKESNYTDHLQREIRKRKSYIIFVIGFVTNVLFFKYFNIWTVNMFSVIISVAFFCFFRPKSLPGIEKRIMQEKRRVVWLSDWCEMPDEYDLQDEESAFLTEKCMRQYFKKENEYRNFVGRIMEYAFLVNVDDAAQAEKVLSGIQSFLREHSVSEVQKVLIANFGVMTGEQFTKLAERREEADAILTEEKFRCVRMAERSALSMAALISAMDEKWYKNKRENESILKKDRVQYLKVRESIKSAFSEPTEFIKMIADTKGFEIPELFQWQDLHVFFQNALFFRNAYRSALALLDYIEMCLRLVVYAGDLESGKMFDGSLVSDNLYHMARRIYQNRGAARLERTVKMELLEQNMLQQLENLLYINFEGDELDFTGLLGAVTLVRNKVVAHGVMSDENTGIVWAFVVYAALLVTDYLEMDQFSVVGEQGNYRIGYGSSLYDAGIYLFSQNEDVCILSSINQNKKKNKTRVTYTNFFSGEVIIPGYIERTFDNDVL